MEYKHNGLKVATHLVRDVLPDLPLTRLFAFDSTPFREFQVDIWSAAVPRVCHSRAHRVLIALRGGVLYGVLICVAPLPFEVSVEITAKKILEDGHSQGNEGKSQGSETGA